MIVAGTAVGAGMFSLPSVSAGMWFEYSFLVLLGTWLSMCVSGLMLMEATLNYPAGNSFDTMARDCLSRPVRLCNSLSVAFVLYILTYAYISGGGSIMAHTVLSFSGARLPTAWASLLFALLLSVIVWTGTRAVGRVSTVMLGGMVLAFAFSVGDLLGNVRLDVLFNTGSATTAYAPFVLAALPFYLTSFGFHGNVPGLVKYYRKDARAVTKTIVYGSFLAFAFYVCWLLSVLGNLPRADFLDIVARGGNMGVLVGALAPHTSNAQLGYLLTIFSHLAVGTSFLGVTLGLFDYVADTLGFDDSRAGRTKTALVTFGPPTLGGILWPDGFIMAIGFAGVAATIFAVIVPALMVRATRRKYGNPLYRTPGGSVMPYVIMVYGATVIVCHVLAMNQWLPVFGR